MYLLNNVLHLPDEWASWSGRIMHTDRPPSDRNAACYMQGVIQWLFLDARKQAAGVCRKASIC
jgi:hypothetical protein